MGKLARQYSGKHLSTKEKPLIPLKYSLMRELRTVYPIGRFTGLLLDKLRVEGSTQLLKVYDEITCSLFDATA